jgi:hypothetical protein
MMSSGRDYLTYLPSDLLTKILAEIPLSSFLDLTDTSRGIPVSIRPKIVATCNAAIRSRFPNEDKLLQTYPQRPWAGEQEK